MISQIGYVTCQNLSPLYSPLMGGETKTNVVKNIFIDTKLQANPSNQADKARIDKKLWVSSVR